MTQATWNADVLIMDMEYLPDETLNIHFLSKAGTLYTIEYNDVAPDGPFQPFIGKGTLTASSSISTFVDDFSSNTSGGPTASGKRFYRIYY